ncbi:MAG: hypothetical protein ACK4SA_13815 [Caldilinea sp.]
MMSSMRYAARHLLLTVALFCALVTPATAVQFTAPQPADFDPDRALAVAYHLAETIGDRPAGTLGEQMSAGWLAGQFAVLSTAH